jgi:hypothetical protein
MDPDMAGTPAQHPHVKTLVQEVTNDIVEVSPDAITVRSHLTMKPRLIPQSAFRQWWEYLLKNGSASLNPDVEDCPEGPRLRRSRIVGAIFVIGLPSRVEADVQKNRIRLKGKPPP